MMMMMMSDDTPLAVLANTVVRTSTHYVLPVDSSNQSMNARPGILRVPPINIYVRKYE